MRTYTRESADAYRAVRKFAHMNGIAQERQLKWFRLMNRLHPHSSVNHNYD